MGVHHHTKDKGDLGVAKVFADLVEQGLQVLFPATEHAPFDLVAYDDGRFIRVQVKYRTAKLGKVTVLFRSCWSDTHGRHIVPMDKESVDVVAVYCPDVDECYYVDPSTHCGGVTLRLRPTGNNQSVGINYARHFRQVPGTENLSRPVEPSPLAFESSTLF